MTLFCVTVTICRVPSSVTIEGDAKNPPPPAVHLTAPVFASNAVSGP